ncbi:MAG TPA: M55 family metallopeptidase [Thermomicrobiales bacterium]|nr:M55 family metallopeptidase [Thermomicrobiales bacterium]
MRVFISVDIEGIAGVAGREEGSQGNPEYERARRLMTAEACAAVRGIYNADPDAEVTVADAHGTFRNIIPELLDPRARLVRGKPRPLAMIEGVQNGVDAAVFVGYHGRAGTGDSVLSHTFTGTLADVRVNGTSFGEIGLNAAVAGVYGVPLVLVTGDASVDAEVEALLPGTRTAVVKRGIGALAADGLHPERACAIIEAAAAEVPERVASAKPFVVDGPVALEVDVTIPAYADQALVVPGIKRLAGRTLGYDAPDYLTAYRITRLIGALSGLPL